MYLNKYSIQYNANLSLIENCAEILKDNPKTFDHVAKVAETGVKLAARFGMDPEKTEKVRTACLLHDISAVIPREDYADLCRAYNIEVVQEEEKAAMLMHSESFCDYSAGDVQHNRCGDIKRDSLSYIAQSRPILNRHDCLYL